MMIYMNAFSALLHFGKAPVTVFQGVAGSGKTTAIMQTVAMNPEAVVVFLNGNLWSHYIRSNDSVVRIEDSDDITIENLVDQLFDPFNTNGNRIFMDVDGAHEEVMSVILAIVSLNPNRDYIFILNDTSNDSIALLDFLKELRLKNARTFIETQCSPNISRDTLRTMDRVLFKTLNANVKLLHSNSPIEKERAILERGEALYISEGNEICKVSFTNAHNIGE